MSRYGIMYSNLGVNTEEWDPTNWLSSDPVTLTWLWKEKQIEVKWIYRTRDENRAEKPVLCIRDQKG